jgi:hypothetical protein
MNMATMQMYCPSLKKNVEATITDGKRVASKGGSLRNIIYGEFEGKKCLPKTVKAEVFAQHGFAAESEGESATYEPSQEPEGSEPATEPTNANFEAYDDPISDRQEYKITSLGGTVDSSMNRSEASDYIKKLQGRKSGTWKEAESSPSSFDISWEDGQGVSSPSLPPEGIHFSEYDKGAEGDYHMNGESCEYCAEDRELNAEGFCSECSRHAESFSSSSSSSYENAFFTETISEMAAEGISRNGKLALSLTALGIGVAMALGSDKVSSLLDKFNRK